LKKALYGLKQAPRAWYARIDGYFQDNGFKISKREPMLYYKQEGNDILIVILYVDDLLYMGTSSKMKDEFKISMMNEFEMKDLGLMQYFMGMEVYQSEDEFFIRQTKYEEDMLKKFDMVDCKPTSTPITHEIVLYRDDGVEIVDETTYISIVGNLMFLTHTRPDITYFVSLVLRYMTEPSEIHMNESKRILRYVKGTLNFGIHYYTSKRFNLVGSIDYDWGGSLDDRNSTSDNCLSFGLGFLTWSSKKQNIVVLSSTEVEYVALTSVGTQALWLRNFLEEIREKQIHPIVIFCDNMSPSNWQRI
jgi:hypothetical protein